MSWFFCHSHASALTLPESSNAFVPAVGAPFYFLVLPLLVQTAELLNRLRGCSAPPVISQYARPFADNALYTLRGNAAAMRQLELSAKSALKPRDEKSDVLLAEGPAGSGKTRLGFEVLRRLEEPDGALQQLLAPGDASQAIAIGLFIDFGNGLALDEDVDSSSMDANIAVRLAARYLGLSMSEVQELNGGTLNGLTTAKVLRAIVDGVLERAGSSAAVPSISGVLLVIHLDEYQMYLGALTRRHKVSTKTGLKLPTFSKKKVMNCFKEMLSAINNWARDDASSAGVRVSFLPVVSGTPVTGLDFAVTDKLTEIPFRPDRLDQDDAAALVADVVLGAAKSHVVREDIVRLLAGEEARIAMADVDYRPRFLVVLGDAISSSVNKAPAGTTIIPDWAVVVSKVLRRVPLSRKARRCETLAYFVLSQTRVHRDVLSDVGSKVEGVKVLESAVRSGEVETDFVDGAYFVLRVPLVQLRRWPVAHVFPPNLFSLVSSSWRDVEFALAYCLRARLAPGLRTTSLKMREVFTGARGASLLPDLVLALGDDVRGVFVQSFQLFTKKATLLENKAFHVLASRAHGTDDVEEVDVRRSVVMTCAGTMAIDLYCAVPLEPEQGGHAYILVQTKKTSNAVTVALTDIDKWYSTVTTLTKRWRQDGDEMIFMFFTNKRLSDDTKQLMDVQFFLDRPGLCVTSLDELNQVIPSFMRTRFISAEQEKGSSSANAANSSAAGTSRGECT